MRSVFAYLCAEAFLVFWGTGIVLFLVKWINLHNDITQGFWVELCQQVETGAFSVSEQVEQVLICDHSKACLLQPVLGSSHSE